MIRQKYMLPKVSSSMSGKSEVSKQQNVFNTGAHNMKQKQTQTWCRRQFYDLLISFTVLYYFNSKFLTILKIVFWSTNLRIYSHSDHYNYIYCRNTNFWIIFKRPSFINMSISQNLTESISLHKVVSNLIDGISYDKLIYRISICAYYVYSNSLQRRKKKKKEEEVKIPLHS